MASIKCNSCNLVNFSRATNCKRCNQDLTVKPIIQPVHNPQFQPQLQPQFQQMVQPVIKCIFCGSESGVTYRTHTSTAGVILFIVLLLFLCLPLCWIGLLIKETHTYCNTCKMQLS